MGDVTHHERRSKLRDGGRIALLLVAALVGCGDAAAPREPDQAAEPSPGQVPELIEILSPGTFRLDGRFVDFDALAEAFVRAPGGSWDPIATPLVIVAPASLEMRDTTATIIAALQPPGRTHVTLRVIEKGLGRETTVPVLTSCLCRAVQFTDGDDERLAHDSSLIYLFVTARIDDDDLLRMHAIDLDEPPGREITGLSDHLPTGAPAIDEPLDLGALRAWFEALRQYGHEPLLCLDYRDSLATSHLVDALTMAKTVLGKRVLLGPNPREPELEDEFADEYAEEFQDDE